MILDDNFNLGVNTPNYSNLLDKIEEVEKSIDFTRPIGEYPTASDIANYIKHRKGTQHIKTKSINIGGKAVQDAMEKYLANDSYSSGQFKAALKTPLHLFFEREDEARRELDKLQDKKHFKLGNFLHECMLEPTKFGRVTVEPKLSRASNDDLDKLIVFWEGELEKLDVCEVNGELLTPQQVLDLASTEVPSTEKRIDKKKYLEIIEKATGITAISETDKIIVDVVKRNYLAYGNGIIPKLLKHSKREISLYTEDVSTGLKVKCRPDSMQFKENIGVNAIISVKSTSAESLSHFYYQSAKLNYELSEGMYQDVASQVTGRDFNTTIMIMLQTVAPYGVGVMVWNGEDIEIGKHKYKQALQTAHECELHGKYPTYDAFAEEGNLGLIDMKQPDWNTKVLQPVDLSN
ncbi:PD-(D/E)XK nuclease-like domain-containing protein [Tenacibaculum sp. 190524A02b]|uniref:PD-(D/E)XK nuclease-like domain-containing protein n=1 Tax=Tenacibaculum vairaonense TaxID=3137860 RepID=UPI0031FB0AE6